MPDVQNLWYKNAIIYAVDVKTFQDSDGGGMGDFRGMIYRLEYLSRLGVNCLWLLPFYPSPLRDNGYDITDYGDVDPRLGTLEDFIELVHRAGELGMRVITELAMNHTSNEHPWFQAARRAKDSRYHHYYCWSDNPPAVLPGGQNAFPGTESSAWNYDDIAGAYYYHLFYKFQPDLNTANPDVLEEMRRFIHLWTAFGVSGFRLDAIGPMVDKRVRYLDGREEPFEILNKIRAAMKERVPEGVLLGEADVPPDQLINYFGKRGRLNMLLNFLMSQYLFLTFAKETTEPLKNVLSILPPAPEDGQWVNFLRNLDELNLDKLAADDRDLVIRTFGPEPKMQLYQRGIRRRIATMLEGDPRRIRMAHSLLFSLRGSPMIVYGGEIGMGDDLSLFERDSVRTSMQWSAAPNAGFSGADPAKLFRPVIREGAYGYKNVNVEQQLADPDSYLNWMKKLLLTRRQCPELGYSHEILECGNPAVLTARSEGKERSILTLHNLSGERQDVELSFEHAEPAGLKTLLGEFPLEFRHGILRAHLEPYGYGWLSIHHPVERHSLTRRKHSASSVLPTNGAYPQEVATVHHKNKPSRSRRTTKDD